MLRLAGCHALSRAEATRVVVEDVRCEDSEEVGRDVGDWAREVDTLSAGCGW